MSQLKLTLETLTPMFLGGADPLGDPELRPSSLRGVMRFWFRALHAGVQGSDNLNALRNAESDVFGNTEKGSPVVVRLQGTPRPEEFHSKATGVRYLFWSVIRGRRRCFPAGARFTLTLQTRLGLRDPKPLERALASLWLLTRLGGMGARSRRGAGSLQVVGLQEVKPPSLLDGVPALEIRSTQPGQLRDEIATGLKRIRASFGPLGMSLRLLRFTGWASEKGPTVDEINVESWRRVDDYRESIKRAFKEELCHLY